jgi:hypothetical protein
MSKVQTLETEIEICEDIVEELREQLGEARGEQFFKCPDCEKRSKVNGLTLLVEHWYSKSPGWIGNDCWNFSQYLVICTKCDHAIRVYDKSKYSDYNDLFDFVQTRKHQFSEVLDYFPGREETIDLEIIRKRNKETRKYMGRILL